MPSDESNKQVKFSLDQEKVVFHDAKKFVVRASPWSGKTFCISGRISHKIKWWNHRNKWMAILSFTNAWKDEIEKSCKEHFGTFITTPHFLWTIDSFINHYIFLPFWHLVLKCEWRPKLVWEPHERWYTHTKGVSPYNIDYLYWCPHVSFNLEWELLLLSTYTQAVEGNILIRKWPNDKPILVDLGYKNNWDKCKQHQELYDEKIKFLRNGYANQADANYFALKILQQYPELAKELVRKFPAFIIDEAQDTSEIQMRILDILEQAGIEEMVYIWDPDQSIYEWNNAKPDIFLEKFIQWNDNSCVLNESYRSTQLICDFTHKLSTLPNCSPSQKGYTWYESVSPKFILYQDTSEWKQLVIDKFLLENSAIPHEEIFITARGGGFFTGTNSQENSAIDKKFFWTWVNHFGRDIFKALTLYREWKLHLCLDRIFYFLCKIELNNTYIERGLFLEWKQNWWDNSKNRIVANHLMAVLWNPKVTQNNNITLYSFLLKTNEILAENGINFSFKIENYTKNTKLNEFIVKHIWYSSQKVAPTKYTISTIHGVKWRTCDAMLLFLKKGWAMGKDYKNLLQEAPVWGQFWHEEIRNIYVAMTRPRKILTIAVPSEEEKQIWEQFFWINTPPSS
jgi:DNA helicase-2/ATP-dependent DNA helicase PcrA